MPDLEALFRPRSIVLVGASPDVASIRGRMVEAVRRHPPGPVYCVSRTHRDVGGFPTVDTVDDLPEPVDLALITVPAQFVADALESCGRRGIRAAAIIGSGFAEEGTDEGRLRQSEVSAIAARHDMAVIGPNCQGIFDTTLPLTATFSPAVLHLDVPYTPPRGHHDAGIAVIAQSGGVGFAVFNRGRKRELRFSTIVSIGNEAGLDSLDVANHLLDDPHTDVVTMFVEGFSAPAKLATVANRAMELGKPLVVAKVGRSDAGAEAVRSHTASLAGSYRIFQAMCSRLGIIEASDIDELVDIAGVLAAWRSEPPQGKRAGVLTGSGGAGVWLADACSDAGLTVPPLDGATRAQIDQHLPPYGSSRNPVDITAQAVAQLGYAAPIEMLAASDEVDAVLVAASLIDSARIAADEQHLARLRDLVGKPVVFCPYTETHPEAREILSRVGIPCVDRAPNAAKAVAALADFAEHRSRFVPLVPTTATPDRSLQEALSPGVVAEHRAKVILAERGLLDDPGVLVLSAEEAARAVERYSRACALKVQSVDVPHKTDVGGVRLGVGDTEARTAYESVLAATAASRPDAAVDGVLVEPMAGGGIEVIVGIERDPGFGPMLLVGLGGVLVEVLDDVALSPVPVSADEARRMIGSLAGAAVLRGARGAPPADVEALVELMVGISRLAEDAGDALESIDLNPVVVHEDGRGVTVVDALMIGSSTHLQSPPKEKP